MHKFNAIPALLISVCLMLPSQVLAQHCYSGHYGSYGHGSYYSGSYNAGYFGHDYYNQSYIQRVIVTSFVYDYPAVPTIVVPAYQLAPAVQVVQPVAAAAQPAGTAVAPTEVKPVVAPVVAPVIPVVYLQPAAVYAVPTYNSFYATGYYPFYRTRSVHYR